MDSPIPSTNSASSPSGEITKANLSRLHIEISARDTVELLRNRVGIRNFAARLLAPGTADGLLIATIQPGNDSWRFTFVHRETRFTADGDLERVETPTRRFTYVLGPDESCRTPDSRFQLLARHCGSTTLAHVLDAFSVEKLIRVINFAEPEEKAAHEAIETLVDSILAAKRLGDEATVKELEGQIDRHVFRLYGLTPEEIALVQNR